MSDEKNSASPNTSEAGEMSGITASPVEGNLAANSKAEEAGSKPSELSSLPALFAYAYGQQGRQVKVPQATFKNIKAQLDPADSGFSAELNWLEDLAAGDNLLAVPPRLLVAVEGSNDSKLLQSRVVKLMIAALRRHPVFRSEKVQQLFDSGDVAVDDAVNSASWACADLTADDVRLPAKSFGSSEREKLRINAITSLILLIAARDDWSVAELVRSLDRHLWRSASRKSGSRAPKVAVSESSNFDALEVVSGVFQADAREAGDAAAAADERAATAQRQAAIANERASAAEARAAEAAARLADRESEIEALNLEITNLKSAIETERHNRVIDESHHLDDYETLRTRLVRVLGKQVDLLADGLHALRHGRIPIADEYMERTVDTLKKELRELRDGE